jgi:hypothetical protein
MSVDGQEEMLEQVQQEVDEQLPNGTDKEKEKLFKELVEHRAELGDYMYSLQKGGE